MKNFERSGYNPAAKPDTACDTFTQTILRKLPEFPIACKSELGIPTTSDFRFTRFGRDKHTE
jgi:hypothetical protein